jgi:hypothetical protein
MSKSYKIRTTPGQENNGYVKVNVDLNQNYDHLEILSLKISQKDDYRSFCADYGVVAGRVIVNGGFGVPNVKVSIFVPVVDSDLENPVISAIYPYTDPFPDKKNQNGIRYNVLPKNQQTFDHTPVGTLPKKREVLDDNTVLEIYEKYYKYTTTTNASGDYILFGVPVGDHFLHYDMDISDIGFISVRPYELIDENGYSEDLFKDRFKYKSSNNLDSLPQIFSENIPITVEPYWCDSLSVGSPLGINRFDIEPSIEITPTSIFMGSVFTDDEKDSINKNCKPSREMGKMDEVITGSGKIEAIRRTVDGNIETFSFNDSAIDDNGNWSVIVPMNMRKVVTDEFGNLVPSPDGVKGIATEGDYRFRISMDATSTDKRLRERAKYLVPNINNNFKFGEYSEKELKTEEIFTINRQLSTITGPTYEDDPTNQYNYLEEFFPFRWKKVYTVKQYIGRMQKTPDVDIPIPGGSISIGGDEARGFIGIKDIINAPGVNKFPTNRSDTNIHPLYVIICILVVIFGHVIGFINGIIQFINGLITMICDIKLPVGVCFSLNFCLRLGSGFCTSDYKINQYSTNFSGDNCGSSIDRNYGQCNNCRNNNSCNKKNEFSLDIELKYKCIFGGILCKNCKDTCGEDPFSCCSCGTVDCPSGCNDGQCGDDSGSCCQDKCCGKVGLIPLRCADEGKELYISLLKSPFAPACNATYVKPFTCVTCGGRQTKGIKDWASCVLEPVAVFLRMLKFDFYNEYFPLVKRKYKLKKNKRKFGQIKKDKFCDFECKERTGIGQFSLNFQGDPTFQQHRIRIPVLGQSNLFPVIEVEGCAARVTLKRSTNWYGTPENEDQTYNLDLAVKEFEFVGKNNNNEKCAITFDTFYGSNGLEAILDAADVEVDTPNREVQTKHGKPTYISVDDNWSNIGGHGHHRNICDNTRMLERMEYFKTSLDCISGCNKLTNDDRIIKGIGGDDEFQIWTCECDTAQLDPYCNQGEQEEGVAPCIQEDKAEYDAYSEVIKHGLISWEDGNIYYTPRIKGGDSKFNQDEYKGNLMLPTTIQELGSSVYCDIDDIPFIMDSLPPTTFNASYEDQKYKLGSLTPDNTGGFTREILSMDDKKNISLNLRAYVEFACTKVICENIVAPVVQSQVGVEIIDKNDLGVEIGNCYLRFDHDDELRNYFCRRFNGYRAKYQNQNGLDLTFHHQRPGSIQFENSYGSFPEIQLIDGVDINYTLPGDSTPILSEYNDGDFFVPGDGCGYVDPTVQSGVDYFYGVAPGQTSGFINYPNNYGSPSGTMSFGQSQTDIGIEGTDEIFGVANTAAGYILTDNYNDGNSNNKGIRFNRSQTPYYLYFGLVPGKTALHKTVSRFFADKINAITLEGVGDSNNSVNENINNAPNVTNDVENNFSVYKTCLGETLIEKVKPQ